MKKIIIAPDSFKETMTNIEATDIIYNTLKEKYPNSLKKRFDIDEITDYKDVLTKISQKRGIITNKGEIDFPRCENLLLKEFKDGTLGRMSLEWL